VRANGWSGPCPGFLPVAGAIFFCGILAFVAIFNEFAVFAASAAPKHLKTTSTEVTFALKTTDYYKYQRMKVE
jgi:hypothetical protein